MLSKNYSTLAILMAANVIDGGKKFEEVPASISTEVGELISSIEGKSFGLTLDSSMTDADAGTNLSSIDNTKEVSK
ncbi:hypothetical protein [Lactobacillus acetotolerans]|uniref:hypothetical protein n=1 Tax=Lactobacillus acetotolerans TaxID=1600 RepID=UPI002FD9EAEE